jgi:DICT domain-containing protein/predicted DNA-binding transcriptional regulator AlpA
MLAIGELVQRTGVREATLRMWEQRHGFPAPERLASGHRRYREEDVDLVAQVLRERAAGLSLGVAIERVRSGAGGSEPSIYAGLRRRRPELQPVVLRRPALLALTRAIEDESCAQAERALLFGTFQKERFYRRSERRWRELARTAELAVVFADFDRVRVPARGPAEVPIAGADPLTREWAVVCEAPGHAVCLAGLELPQSSGPSDSRRRFEVVWSVEPEVVRTATHICLGLTRRASPQLADRLAGEDRLAPAGPPSDRQLRLATAIATRTLGRLG